MVGQRLLTSPGLERYLGMLLNIESVTQPTTHRQLPEGQAASRRNTQMGEDKMLCHCFLLRFVRRYPTIYLIVLQRILTFRIRIHSALH